jgi:hypothetical protein
MSCRDALAATLGAPALMPSGSDERYDFFLSRRGSVTAIGGWPRLLWEIEVGKSLRGCVSYFMLRLRM